MEKMPPVESEKIMASDVNLTGLYVISVLAMVFGVLAVFLLNVATPTAFIFDRFAELKAVPEAGLVPFVARRLGMFFLIILLIAFPSMFIMNVLLRPVSCCLKRMRNGIEVENRMLDKARRRIINLPFFLWEFLQDYGRSFRLLFSRFHGLSDLSIFARRLSFQFVPAWSVS